MSTDFQPFIDFHSWVDKEANQVAGTDCLGVTSGTDALGNGAKYIPLDTLEQYWQDNPISHILNSCRHETPIHVCIDDILTRYLRIFSILVYISTPGNIKLTYIKSFTAEDINDTRLPFKNKPDAFSNAVDGIHTFELFQENQWLFSPVALGPNTLQSKDLLPQSVLPFTVQEVLAGGNGEGTTVKKCEVHPSCGLPADTIVLKEFQYSEIEYSFKNEVDSYITLKNNVLSEIVYEQHFLKYHGSFKKADKAFIMLEYTDQGSLWDFFQRNELPLERHELYNLWSSLSNLFVGLEHIHSLERSSRNRNEGTIRCVHQDLKPSNIFVFRQGDGTSYRYHFKIGDFGMSSIALVRSTNKSVRGTDNDSTRMYGAPELTNHYPALASIDYGALWDIDIWSMGCVLFEVLVWTTCGFRGLSEFFRMRQRETEIVPKHTPQGYSGCFHNGETRIQAVDKMFGIVKGRKRVFDDLSDSIGKLILREMLRPSDKSRLEAKTLLHRFEEVLEPGNRQPDPLDTTSLPGGGTSHHGIAEEGRGEKGLQKREQARVYATDRANDYGSQRPESTSGSVSRARSSRRGADESLSSIETRPTHEGSISTTSMQRSDRGVPQKSSSVTDGPHLEEIPPQTDVDDHLRSQNPPPAGDRSHSGNTLHGTPDVASGSNSLGPEPYARVTIAQVLQWMTDKKKNGWAPEPLRDHERALREINGREQIFVVDDSTTMRRHHWDQVVKVVHALGYLVKHADPDGVELFFTSRPTKAKKSGAKEITSLVRSLEEHGRKRPEGPCNMENSLGPILDHVKSGLTKGSMFRQQTSRRGISVYILTDAIWQGGTELRCGVEEPIKNLSRTMQELGKHRTTVALQFIQFGDDLLGEKRLRYLDDTLGSQLDFDIVDHRHCERDGVWHMLVGSISRDLDKDNNVESRTAITCDVVTCP